MAHNGGRSQANFWFQASDNLYLMENRFKNANFSGYANDTHDANGYMHTHTYSPQYVFFVPSQTDRPGDYVIAWDGAGTFTLGFSQSAVSGSLTAGLGQNGYYRFSTTQTRFVVNLTAIGADGVDYPHNIRVYHIDAEANLAADPYAFNPYVLAKLSKIGVIRFLDYNQSNISQILNFSDQLPEAYYSYDAPYIPPALFAGSTTNVGDAYSATLTGATLTNGQQVVVVWNATSAGLTPTFNLNGTGDVSIWDATATAPHAYSVRKPLIGKNSLLTYNAALNVWLQYGGSTEVQNGGIKSGFPYSIIAKLCKETGAHPWICLPYMTLDVFNNFTTDVATYFREYAVTNAPWMVPRFEINNEVWNSASGFYAARYGWALEDLRIGSAGNFDIHNWFGRAAAKAGKAISAVYSDDRTKYQVIAGVQTNSGTLSSSNNRLNSTRYLTEPGIVASDAAKYWATHVAITNYYHSSFGGTATAISMADEYASATASRKLEIEDEYVFSAAGSEVFDWESTKTKVLAWKNWADGFGTGLKVCFYEGGWDQGYSESSGNLGALIQAVFFSSALYRATQLHYQYFISIGAEYPSKYTITGDSYWGAHQLGIYDAPSAEWNATIAWSERELRFKLTPP